LPEAQLDRFRFLLSLGYPGAEAELLILEREERANPLDDVQPALTLDDILHLQTEALRVEVARPVTEYIVRLITATRAHPDVMLGVRPRGGVALQRAAQAMALLNDRPFAMPDDVKAAAATLSHRLITRARGLATRQKVIRAC
jgi:MoxR-like ATPase